MKHLYRIVAVVLIVTGLSLASGTVQFCSAAGDEASGNDTAQVSIKLFRFDPEILEVPVGTTVVWSNGDAIQHSVTNGTPGSPGSAFDSDFFTEGQTWSYTFTEAGEYPYFCKRHNSMQGKIIVEPEGR